MKNKFEAFFKAQQEKGAWEGQSYDSLNEEQMQELMAGYLDNLEKGIAEAQAKAEKAEGGSTELQTQIKEMQEEQIKATSKYTEVLQKFALSATNKLIDSVAVGKEQKINEAIKEAKEFCAKVDKAARERRSDTFTIKADTLTTSVQNFTRGVEDPVVTRLAHRRLTAYDSILSKPRIPANAGGTYRYMEVNSASSVRAAAAIAEGIKAPESTIVFTKQSLDLKKVGDYVPYSIEFQYDFQNLMQELTAFLIQNVSIEVDDQIINGDGIGANYDGIITTIPAYVPAAQGQADANFFDLACYVKDNITATEGSKYNPNIIYMTSGDKIKYLATRKDGENRYLDLMAKLEQMGFVIVENNSLAANTAIIGDARYIHVIEDGMVTVETGVKVGDDALEGIENILVTTRKNLLIKSEETTGWRKITSISAALTTIAT